MRLERTKPGAPPLGGVPAAGTGRAMVRSLPVRSVPVRSVLVRLHRWLGLATALFLAVAGLTGSVLAFQHELDEWLNPHFYAVSGGAPALPPERLIETVERAHPALQVWYMEYAGEGDHSALLGTVPRTDPATGQPFAVTQYVFYLDPATGKELGRRQWGQCCFEPENLVPFLLEFHYTLRLPGGWGLYLMGGVAILWTLDCLIALLLTFPRGRPFFAKWRPAWTVKPGNAHRVTLDLHRAGGLWLWLILLPVAVSSIAMNLPSQVFKPAVSLFSPAPLSVYEQRARMPREDLGTTKLSYGQALARAKEEAAFRGVREPVGELYYSFEYNFYGFGFGDHDAPRGSAWIFVHGTDGHFLGQEIPGQGSAGESFVQWQTPIHGGRIAGLPGRIVVAVTGVAIAVLSVTGILIWWRKRRARRAARPAS